MRKLKRAVIKEELVEITGNYKLAIVLNQLLYWAERVGSKRYKKWLEEESNRKLDEVNDLKGGWIYKSASDLKNEIMLNVTTKTIRNWLKKLVEQGFLLERNNSKNKMDQTKQYRINAIKLVRKLEKEGYHLEGYKYDELLRSLAARNRNNFGSNCNDFDCNENNFGSNCNDFGAIPETTSEITTKTTKNKTEEEDARARAKGRPENPQPPDTSQSESDTPKVIAEKFEEIFNRKLSIDFYNKMKDIYSDPKILLHALRIAEEKGDKPAYVLAILKDWSKNGLGTVDMINDYIEDRAAEKKANTYNNNNRNEVNKNPEYDEELVEKLQDPEYLKKNRGWH
ncbi:DnaD domain protein [Halarsenatibacter silvermanii]|uniref:DnaD and phage-associated domain-containing protein n=1 Tax=Halarsenatibacter silvermanii TaxID=321763 RepID=A0A1G9RWA4_9FIRM|nr:DnaD domain protein [Halarsenatibacter silvermanii]SDM27511.1 DnaD and phage-associated domain-containing protein [Halarsenatibacter silvermanii]